MRIEERLRESAAGHGGAHPAVVAARGSHSYTELDCKSERLAAALQASGVRRGDCVMMFMDDGWEAVVSVFAVLKAGGVLAPVGAGATVATLCDAMQKDQPVAVITQSRLATMVATAISSVWSVRLIVLAGGDRARAGGTCISFEEAVARVGRMVPLATAGADTDPAIQFNGEAPLTHCQIAEDAAAAASCGDGILLPPLAERSGFSRLLAAIAAGRTMIARLPFAHDDSERRVVDVPPAKPRLRISVSTETVLAGGMPVFQR